MPSPPHSPTEGEAVVRNDGSACAESRDVVSEVPMCLRRSPNSGGDPRRSASHDGAGADSLAESAPVDPTGGEHFTMVAAMDSASKSPTAWVLACVGLGLCLSQGGCARLRSATQASPMMLGAAAP